MSYSASDLQNDVDRLLDRLGLEITGDDCDGYTVRHAGRDLTTARGTIFDTAAEATAAALDGLIDLVEDLISASKVVIVRWEHGDLAEAVRELDVCVRVVDGTPASQSGAEKAEDRRQTRLRHLVRDGLRFDECVTAFSVTERQVCAVATARSLFHQRGAIEIPAATVVSRDERGTAVMAWARVCDEAEPLDLLP
ncbi:hypothetical protein [Ideonella sp. YS5]|uniref:hypothetical protein n=1 Tax=Ideonella sp. YS5 TaxID=3453714 RepID=UPI003EEEC002